MAKIDFKNLTVRQALLLASLGIAGFVFLVASLVMIVNNGQSGSANVRGSDGVTIAPSPPPVNLVKCWASRKCLKNADDEIVSSLQKLRPFERDAEFMPELQAYIGFASQMHSIAYLGCASKPALENPDCWYLTRLDADVGQTAFVLRDLKQSNFRDSVPKWLERTTAQLEQQRALIDSNKQLSIRASDTTEMISLEQQIDEWNRRTAALFAISPSAKSWLAVKNADIRLDRLKRLTSK